MFAMKNLKTFHDYTFAGRPCVQTQMISDDAANDNNENDGNVFNKRMVVPGYHDALIRVRLLECCVYINHLAELFIAAFLST